MPRQQKLSSNLHSSKQSTGMRPLIAFCIVSVLLLTFYLREGDAGPVHSLRSAAMTVTTPFRLAGSALASPFGAVGNAVTNATASPETMSDLKKENERLTKKVAELSEAEKTAERLQGLVGLQSTYKLKSTAARIIGSTGDAWSNTVTLDKGASSGFEPGMPVCGDGGVIGQIIETSASTSTVRLITDEQSGISAMIQSSRAQGMLQGQADGTLRLSYVPAEAEVKEGDIIITSGIGGMFPKGLPLGTVASVERASNAVYYTIVVRAASTAESNEEVLVVTSIGEDQVASDEDVTAANSTPQGGAATDPTQDGEQGQAQDQGQDGAAADSGADE